MWWAGDRFAGDILRQINTSSVDAAISTRLIMNACKLFINSIKNVTHIPCAHALRPEPIVWKRARYSARPDHVKTHLYLWKKSTQKRTSSTCAHLYNMHMRHVYRGLCYIFVIVINQEIGTVFTVLRFLSIFLMVPSGVPKCSWHPEEDIRVGVKTKNSKYHDKNTVKSWLPI